MSKAAADPPYAADVPADLLPLDADVALLPEAFSWSGAALEDAQLGGLERTGLSIVGSRLERVDLAAARLPNLRIVDAVLHGCNLANVQARGASLVRCELRDLHGVERLRGVAIEWDDLLELAPALAAALGIGLLDAGAGA